MLNMAKTLGALLALLGAAMSFDDQHRVIAVLAVLAIVAIGALVVLSDFDHAQYLPKTMLLPCLALILLAGASLVAQGFGPNIEPVTGPQPIRLRVILLNAALLLALVLALHRFDCDSVLIGIGWVSGGLALLFVGLKLTGVEVYSNPNNYAALMVIPLLQLRERRSLLVLALFLVTGLAAYQLDARLMLILVGLIWLSGARLAQTSIARILAVLGLFAAIAANLFYSFNFNLVLNALTTNRVFIWNAYGERITQKPWFGWGDLSGEVGREVARLLAGTLGRATGEAYGPQSLYLRYAYEHGWIGLIVVLALFAYALLAARRMFYPLLLLMAAGLLESLKLGAPSILGIPLTVIFLAALSERHRSLRLETPRDPQRARAVKGSELKPG